MVRDQIRDKLPYDFVDLGEQSVKNITRPVRVYALRSEAGATLQAPNVALAPPISQPRERRFVFVVGSGARASYRNTRDTRNTLTRVRMQRATSASPFSSFVLRIISEARLSLLSSRDLFD
jgi:hypothetical protein